MIHLSEKDISFMLEVLHLPPRLRQQLEDLKIDGELTDADADELRDLCGERLQTHGFGPNYEPTEEGRRLEALVDTLFTG